MKIRCGHVSNSSSSSFIIGFAEIKNENMFYKYLKDNNIKVEDGEIEIAYGSEFKASRWLDIAGGNNTEIYVDRKAIRDGHKYVRLQVGNNEGDSDFWDEESEEYDYDKADYEWFDRLDQSKYIDLFSQDFLDVDGFEYGAERNG